MFREMLAELLRLDAARSSASSPPHGRRFAALDRRRPELALVDLVPPDLSGLELVRSCAGASRRCASW
ncbi:MAG: hypothetical protein IPG96_08160 [Proteobacteria bacterium]|nr:hypothetical protein [Pseudomonadota bacterium]